MQVEIHDGPWVTIMAPSVTPVLSAYCNPHLRQMLGSESLEGCTAFWWLYWEQPSRPVSTTLYDSSLKDLFRYNVINNWDYVGVAKAFDNGAGHVIASRVSECKLNSQHESFHSLTMLLSSASTHRHKHVQDIWLYFLEILMKSLKGRLNAGYHCWGVCWCPAWSRKQYG